MVQRNISYHVFFTLSILVTFSFWSFNFWKNSGGAVSHSPPYIIEDICNAQLSIANRESAEEFEDLDFFEKDESTSGYIALDSGENGVKAEKRLKENEITLKEVSTTAKSVRFQNTKPLLSWGKRLQNFGSRILNPIKNTFKAHAEMTLKTCIMNQTSNSYHSYSTDSPGAEVVKEKRYKQLVVNTTAEPLKEVTNNNEALFTLSKILNSLITKSYTSFLEDYFSTEEPELQKSIDELKLNNSESEKRDIDLQPGIHASRPRDNNVHVNYKTILNTNNSDLDGFNPNVSKLDDILLKNEKNPDFLVMNNSKQYGQENYTGLKHNLMENSLLHKAPEASIAQKKYFPFPFLNKEIKNEQPMSYRNNGSEISLENTNSYITLEANTFQEDTNENSFKNNNENENKNHVYKNLPFFDKLKYSLFPNKMNIENVHNERTETNSSMASNYNNFTQNAFLSDKTVNDSELIMKSLVNENSVNLTNMKFEEIVSTIAMPSNILPTPQTSSLNDRCYNKILSVDNLKPLKQTEEIIKISHGYTTAKKNEDAWTMGPNYYNLIRTITPKQNELKLPTISKGNHFSRQIITFHFTIPMLAPFLQRGTTSNLNCENLATLECEQEVTTLSEAEKFLAHETECSVKSESTKLLSTAEELSENMVPSRTKLNSLHLGNRFYIPLHINNELSLNQPKIRQSFIRYPKILNFKSKVTDEPKEKLQLENSELLSSKNHFYEIEIPKNKAINEKAENLEYVEVFSSGRNDTDNEIKQNNNALEDISLEDNSINSPARQIATKNKDTVLFFDNSTFHCGDFEKANHVVHLGKEKSNIVHNSQDLAALTSLQLKQIYKNPLNYQFDNVFDITRDPMKGTQFTIYPFWTTLSPITICLQEQKKENENYVEYFSPTKFTFLINIPKNVKLIKKKPASGSKFELESRRIESHKNSLKETLNVENNKNKLEKSKNENILEKELEKNDYFQNSNNISEMRNDDNSLNKSFIISINSPRYNNNTSWMMDKDLVTESLINQAKHNTGTSERVAETVNNTTEVTKQPITAQTNSTSCIKSLQYNIPANNFLPSEQTTKAQNNSGINDTNNNNQNLFGVAFFSNHTLLPDNFSFIQDFFKSFLSDKLFDINNKNISLFSKTWKENPFFNFPFSHLLNDTPLNFLKQTNSSLLDQLPNLFDILGMSNSSSDLFEMLQKPLKKLEESIGIVNKTNKLELNNLKPVTVESPINTTLRYVTNSPTVSSDGGQSSSYDIKEENKTEMVNELTVLPRILYVHMKEGVNKNYDQIRDQLNNLIQTNLKHLHIEHKALANFLSENHKYRNSLNMNKNIHNIGLAYNPLYLKESRNIKDIFTNELSSPGFEESKDIVEES